MIELSVIIPTRNRADYLKDSLWSILKQSFDKDLYEVIVIDNGSTDNTKEIADTAITACPNQNIRYFHESAPGLHNGRHRGAKEAKGEILVFVDDDIIAAAGWLEAIKGAFDDSAVALAGGKILPKWEGDVPDWINAFKNENEFGWTIGYLSLLDFGDERRDIPATYVYGCNFSIRKSVLYECGGFHPDSMPQELIRDRGDGETALSFAIMEKGYRSIYEPKAAVYHRVPPGRLTAEYFCQRAFNQGISDSYTSIRKNGGLAAINSCARSGIISFIRSMLGISRLLQGSSVRPDKEQKILSRIQSAYEEGKRYHGKEAAADPKLLAYVLQEKYY